MADRQSRIRERFDAVVDAAGGTDRPDWLATVSPDEHLRERLGALATTVTERGTAEGDASIPVAYESSLDDGARGDAGHFVTDVAVATALCRWAIQPRPDGRCPRVLDPATGSGVFAVAAAERLSTLAPDAAPSERLPNVVGVDRDPIALALTAERLLARVPDASDSPLSLYESNFFDVSPSPDRSVTVTGDGVEAGSFDAVVGNPPYVRQETVDTERMREHLASFGPAGQTPYRDGDRALSRRSDAYVYFLTHATQFLREGGRLGVVVPAKWLTTRYGDPLQQFLFDHYRLHGVVGFDSRAFPDALVDTVLLLAERTDETTRHRTPTRFLRLDDQQSVAALLATLEAATTGSNPSSKAGSTTVTRADGARAVTVRQADLDARDSAKLAHYLEAPAPLVDLLESAPLVALSSLGTVRRGVMTGANDFFFIDADSGAAADLADRFLAPAIKSVRDVDSRLLTASDADRYLLDVHEYVTDVDTDDATDPTAAVTDALARDGHDALLAYLERGERAGYHERQSCATRPVWFDLGPLAAPAVFLPKFFDRRVFAIANPDGLAASNAVDCLDLPPDGDDHFVLGLLNSTVTQATLECWGRSEGGGALQLMTYEMTTLPVPDPGAFSPAARDAVRDATTDLLDGDEDARDRLDELVVDALDLPLSVERLRDCRERMVERRVASSERTRPPLVLED